MTVSQDKLIESAKNWIDNWVMSRLFTKVNEIIIDYSDTNKVADLYNSYIYFKREGKISKHKSNHKRII